jgi:ketosteroid isomerase-like protein
MTVVNIMGRNTSAFIHNYIHSLEEKNIEETLSYFTDDATWIIPQNKIKGKKEIEGYVLWLFKNIEELTFINDGIGVMAHGNKAIYQNILKATIKNNNVRIPTMFIFRLKENKFSKQWIINNWFEYTQTIPFNTRTDEIGNIIQIGWNRDYSNL